jgi:hypothetical protein
MTQLLQLKHPKNTSVSQLQHFLKNSSASASLKNLTIASAIFSGEGSTIKPVFPSRTTSGRPPTFVAITGLLKL